MLLFFAGRNNLCGSMRVDAVFVDTREPAVAISCDQLCPNYPTPFITVMTSGDRQQILLFKNGLNRDIESLTLVHFRECLRGAGVDGGEIGW